MPAPRVYISSCTLPDWCQVLLLSTQQMNQPNQAGFYLPGANLWGTSDEV
jgi:hypothetical protein